MTKESIYGGDQLYKDNVDDDKIIIDKDNVHYYTNKFELIFCVLHKDNH